MIDFEALFLEVYGDRFPEEQPAATLGSPSSSSSSPLRSPGRPSDSGSSSSVTVSPSSTASSAISDHQSSISPAAKKGRRRRRRPRRKGREDKEEEQGSPSSVAVAADQDNMGLKLSKYIQKATSSTGGQNCCDHVSMLSSVKRRSFLKSVRKASS